LIGVTIGILIFLTFLSSLGLAKVRPAIPRACAGALVLVMIEGWLGAVLIDTNLADWAISLHLLGALLIVALLVYALVRARNLLSGTAGVLATVRLGRVFAVVLILSIGQIALGTQVRDQIDDAASKLEGQRELWIDQLGWSYLVHRSGSILVFLANIVLYRRISRATLASGDLVGAARVLLVLLGIQIATGVGLSYLGMPPILQPLHLLVAALVAGWQFGMWTMYRHQGRSAL
jgi:cytochrome c oxidase assembly protein subunit 15